MPNMVKSKEHVLTITEAPATTKTEGLWLQGSGGVRLGWTGVAGTRRAGGGRGKNDGWGRICVCCMGRRVFSTILVDN